MAIPKLRRELERVSKFNQSIIWHHYMKGRVESCYLTKFYAFGINRDQVMDLETWLQIHRNVSSVKTVSPKSIWTLQGLMISVISFKNVQAYVIFFSASFKWWMNDGILQLSQNRVYMVLGGRRLNIRYVCMVLEPCLKVHNLVNWQLHVVSDYRLFKLWNSPQFPAQFLNSLYK